MTCECCEEAMVLRLGDEVPDFVMKTYDPVKKVFGEFSLNRTREAKKWTILFFYPADFTFV